MHLFKVQWDDVSEDDDRAGEPCVLFVKAESPRDAAQIIYDAHQDDDHEREEIEWFEAFLVLRIAHEEVEGAGIVQQRFQIEVRPSELRKKGSAL